MGTKCAAPENSRGNHEHGTSRFLPIIRARMDDLKFDNKKLADALGCSRSKVSRILSGHRELDYNDLVRIFSVLDIPLATTLASPLAMIPSPLLSFCERISRELPEKLIDGLGDDVEKLRDEHANFMMGTVVAVLVEHFGRLHRANEFRPIATAR